MYYNVVRRISLYCVKLKNSKMVKVLHVAEKNDAAKSIARIMSNNSSQTVLFK